MNSINWENMADLFCRCMDLAKEKNRLYGIDNLLVYEGLGIIVRMNDKVSRINNIVQSDMQFQKPVSNESLSDTLMDLINYAAYLYLHINKSLVC